MRPNFVNSITLLNNWFLTTRGIHTNDILVEDVSIIDDAVFFALIVTLCCPLNLSAADLKSNWLLLFNCIFVSSSVNITPDLATDTDIELISSIYSVSELGKPVIIGLVNGSSTNTPKFIYWLLFVSPSYAYKNLLYFVIYDVTVVAFHEE